MQEERNKQDQINTEFKNKVMDHALGVMKFSKVFFIIPVIIFSFININKSLKNDYNKVENNLESMFESVIDENNKEKNITVNFNEYGATKNYQIKVTKYEVAEDRFKKAEEGNELVKFYLMVENLSNKQLTKEDVYCIVNGIY